MKTTSSFALKCTGHFTPRALIGGIALLSLSACVTGPSVSPVEVTRFNALPLESRSFDLRSAMCQSSLECTPTIGSIFVENATSFQNSDLPSPGGISADPSVYQSAITAKLVETGFPEAPRDEATNIVQIKVDRYIARQSQRRSPVSVGVGGGAGSHGSGMGVGIGINLGGGKREMIGTDVNITIRDKESGTVLWEGRASMTSSDNSEFTDSRKNAAVIADAMLRDFPGKNGETITVKVQN